MSLYISLFALTIIIIIVIFGNLKRHNGFIHIILILSSDFYDDLKWTVNMPINCVAMNMNEHESINTFSIFLLF